MIAVMNEEECKNIGKSCTTCCLEHLEAEVRRCSVKKLPEKFRKIPRKISSI